MVLWRHLLPTGGVVSGITVTSVFTQAARADLRAELLSAAEGDKMIDAAALFGSAARDAEDRWSDIDLAFGLAPGCDVLEVAARWTHLLYQSHGARAHVDIWSGDALYRVFLMDSTLQIDLSFWPVGTLRATGGPLRLVFGRAADAAPLSKPDLTAVIGMAWLYALHARSSIARGRGLQAVHMLNGLRDQVVTLGCLRAGLPASQGRGVDDLDAPLRRRIEDSLATNLAEEELRRVFAALVSLLLEEAAAAAPEAAGSIEDVLQGLINSFDG